LAVTVTITREAPSAQCGHDAEALFPEARRRRRRIRITFGFLVLALAIGIGLALSQGGDQGHSGHHRNTAATAPRVSPPPTPRAPGIALPTSGLFTQISIGPHGLLLSGETPATAESLDPTCVAGAVNPATLTVGPLQTGSCGDPLLYGRTVEAVNTPILETNNATVSINTANPVTGQVSDGPVVMTYASLSDTRPVMAYGTQWLWIYDVKTTNGAELLQVSAQSGEVVRTLPMPDLYRPLLAADDDGVWVGNSVEGSAATALSYVSADSSTPTTVISNTSVPICWITADGSTVWVGAGTPQGRCTSETIERFADGDQSTMLSTAIADPFFTVVGSEADGLWTMQWSASDPNQQQIIHIDPDTGDETVVATLPAPSVPSYQQALVAGQAVYFNGSLYLLEPPYRINGYLGYSSIVRVGRRANHPSRVLANGR
jgi:hypothetical protein